MSCREGNVCVIGCMAAPDSTLVKPFVNGEALRKRFATETCSCWSPATRNYNWIMSQGEHKDVLFLSRVVDDCRKLDFRLPWVAGSYGFCSTTIGYYWISPFNSHWRNPLVLGSAATYSPRRLRYVKLFTTKSSDAEIPLHLAAQQGLVDAGQHGNGKCPGSNGIIYGNLHMFLCSVVWLITG